jgi:hypothetical protein
VISNVRSPALRRAQVSFGAMWAGEWAVMVALGVVAFRAGGAGAVGAVTAVRMVAAAALAPLAATSADAVRRERVLAWIGATRAASLGAAAAVLAAGGPVGAVYALAVVATVSQTLYRPAHSALLPALCTSAQQLTSANAVRGMLDSLATLGGPLLAAALLAAGSPAAVFAAAALASLAAGALVVGLPYDPPPRSRRASAPPTARSLLEGFAAIAAEPDLRRITALTTVQTFTRGCFSVLSVVVAIELLGTGEPGVGVLTAAVGGGAVLGSLLAFRLAGPSALAAWFGLGVALWGVPLAAIGALPEAGAAVAFAAVIGIGNAFVDVGAFTLPARLADETVLARMFAAFEAVLTLGVAAGAALTPVAIDALGTRGALVAAGLLGPAAVALSWPALRRLDARMRVRDSDLDVLRRVTLLEPLPQATIEQLGAALEHSEIPAGVPVFAQGERGERFYVIVAGRAEVVRDGRLVEVLAGGECFGEIALLRETVRTATVRASAEGMLRVATLPRSPFLTAVCGFPASTSAGEQLVTTRLEALSGGSPTSA